MIGIQEFSDLQPGDLVMTLRWGKGVVMSRKSPEIVILRTMRRPVHGPQFTRGEILKVLQKYGNTKGNSNPKK